MSKPRYWWWSTVRTAVRQYPKLRAKKDDMQSMQVTRAVKSITRTGNCMIYTRHRDLEEMGEPWRILPWWNCPPRRKGS